MHDAIDEIVQRFDQVRGQRVNFESNWQQAADVMDPMGGDYNTKRSPGEKRTERIYEMTGANALEKFTAAMEAFHTPRTQRWHNLRASDEELNKDKSVREWFESAEDLLFKMRNAPAARFYGQMYEVYKNLGLTGNGCLFVVEGPSGGVRYRYTHVGQTYIETNFEGVVDTVYYEYELTARAAVQKWGSDVPANISSDAKSQPLAKHKFLHVVRPNRDRDPERKDAAGKPFESIEIAMTERQMVGKPGGYEEFPYIWTRYTVNPSEVYGRGPAQMALPDVLTLQEMQKTFLRAGHKVVDPPLLVHDDRKMGRGAKKIRLESGGINVGGVSAEGRPLIQPLVTGGRLDLNDAMMDTLREGIRDIFLNGYFDILADDRVQMTAYEVAERMKEKGQLLAPVIGRQQSELLGPLIVRELGIAQRQGLLPPLPDALIEADGEYEIEYESDATRMQRSDEIAAFVRLNEVMAPYYEANPALLQKIDAEEAMEHYGHDLGVPAKLFHSEDEMEEIHAQQAEAVERERLMQEIPAGAKAAHDVGLTA